MLSYFVDRSETPTHKDKLVSFWPAREAYLLYHSFLKGRDLQREDLVAIL